MCNILSGSFQLFKRGTETETGMQKLEWSPELWIRNSNLDEGSVSGDGSLTFSDIVKIGKYN